MQETSFKTRLNWQCRRGMLELDVILIPFLEQHFEQLSEAQQLSFQALLKAEDPDLYTWIMGYGECPDESLLEIIQLVIVKTRNIQ